MASGNRTRLLGVLIAVVLAAANTGCGGSGGRVRHVSRFLRSGSPNCWHCETPLYAAGGRIFFLRTLIWGARGVKGSAHCAISVASHSCAKDAQEWGTPALVAHASKA